MHGFGSWFLCVSFVAREVAVVDFFAGSGFVGVLGREDGSGKGMGICAQD
jgi:hypothetical protein